MRVLIVAEGKHERSGALERLVRRVSHRQELECETDRANRADLHAVHGKGRGFFKRSIRWLLKAEKQGYDALVFVIDEDGHPEPARQINDAQGNETTALPRAFGVAVRTFDAWMLADEQALTQVLGFQVQRQRDPETIVDPKEQCAGLLARSDLGMTQTAMYKAVANAANLETVEERCPRGFRPFAQRVRDI